MWVVLVVLDFSNVSQTTNPGNSKATLLMNIIVKNKSDLMPYGMTKRMSNKGRKLSKN